MKNDPFRKNTSYGEERATNDWIRNFQFEEGMALPVQILKPPEDLFPDGFPVIERHWIVIGKKDNGKDKYGPPMDCTAGRENTKGHCLVCHAKAASLISADRGNSRPSEEMIVPIYDHAKYRSIEGKYRPINPAMPIMDPAMQQQLIVGGLKAMYVSDAQYRKLRAEHDNLQNECAACGGQMMLESMACEECKAPAYEPKHLALLNTEDFNRVRYTPHACAVCSHVGVLDTNLKCGACQSHDARGIFDSVIMAGYTSSTSKTGRRRNEYTFSAANGYELAAIDTEELKEFWEKLHRYVTAGVTIQQQAEKLGIQPPKEWLQELSGSAPGGRNYGA